MSIKVEKDGPLWDPTQYVIFGGACDTEIPVMQVGLKTLEISVRKSHPVFQPVHQDPIIHCVKC